jgi:UDP-N-acetylmuramoylalanine--D-glutamate ligase
MLPPVHSQGNPDCPKGQSREPAQPGNVPVNSLRDQEVLILGLGASGLAMARWCARCGAKVTVADTRAEPPQLQRLRQDVPGAQFLSAAMDRLLVEGTSIRAVFRSPGLSPASVADVQNAARAMGLWTGGELSLFTRALAELKASRGYVPQVLGISGTNGKTTVTSLTGQLIKRAGKSVMVAGNIGPTLLDTLGACLDADALPEIWVLELSSFQLESASDFEPTAATVLNLTQDHLDWHVGMEAYSAAKAKVFGEHGLMVLNRDDPKVMAMRPAPVRVRLQRPVEREMITFGGDMPQRPGDFGIELVNGIAWLVRALEGDETHRRRKDDVEALHIQRLMPADALRIRGRHNAVNALAALALAGAAGCTLASMLYGLREYRGEPHRVEPVGVLRDVEYFDDSKGTNVGATVAALDGLGADRKVVVILGGESKGQDFSPLALSVTRSARTVVLIGRDAPLIRSALEKTAVPLLDAASMAEAVRLASQHAHAGDAVLMSPACASFDMFRNYEHRAAAFRDAVMALADEAGLQLEVAA